MRNQTEEINAFESRLREWRKRRGYVVECKHYAATCKVAGREVHLLSKKQELVKSAEAERIIFIATSDFTVPTHDLHDGQWNMELIGFEELCELLGYYKAQEGPGFYLIVGIWRGRNGSCALPFIQLPKHKKELSRVFV